MEYKILDLPLKKEWYNLIESGVKTEEYREIKPYWCNRLLNREPLGLNHWKTVLSTVFKVVEERKHVKGALHHLLVWNYKLRGYTHVRFRFGYTKRTMLFELNDIVVGKGNKELGAPDNEVFILKLGKRVE